MKDKQVKNQDQDQNIDSSELNQAKEQAQEYLNCWKRATADYQNLKKETEKRQAEFVKFANAALIFELLPILNNFKAAFNCLSAEQKQTDWVKGIEHIKKQLEDLMKNLGIEEIKTVGEKFDPNLHEAIEKAGEPANESGEETKDEIVVKEVQPGYQWHGKVIVPAKVIVSS